MIVHHHLNKNNSISESVVTMGSFDGVHLGHQKILEKVVETARKQALESVLITFDQHPRKVLQKAEEPLKLLTTPYERRMIFEKIGIGHLVCLSFNEELAAMKAEDFIRDIFVGQLKAKYIITGYGHRFGKGGKGDHDLLALESEKYGYHAEMIPMQDIRNNMISSTLIRNFLNQGMVENASQYLGYAYPLTGTIVKGNRIGKDLGFPTANISPLHPEKLIPGDGVYAVRAIIEGLALEGMMNIGHRPTVQGTDKTLEVHLFNFDRDVYGKEISITFEHRIREEKRFESLEALQQQLIRDKQTAQSLLIE